MLAREFGEDLFEKKKKAENRGKEACVAVTLSSFFYFFLIFF
jgi:hypothetical protein